MRKKRLRACIFASAFLFFLILMDYPYLSRFYNDLISGRVIASWKMSEEEADCEKRLFQAQEYNRYLAGEGERPEWLHVPEDFPSGIGSEDNRLPGQAQGEGEEGSSGTGSEDNRLPEHSQGESPEDTSFRKEWLFAAGVLCLEQPDLAGWIRIPPLDLILPLYIGTGDGALGRGAGILEERSLPVGGVSTHTCISAHRGLPERTLFTNLDLLKAGDRIEVHTLGRTIVYEVTGEETVLPSDIRHLAILPGQDLLTLITCTPYGINSHRLYVHARRCTGSDGEDEPVKSEHDSVSGRLLDPVFWKLWWWAWATPVLLVILILVVRSSLR